MQVLESGISSGIGYWRSWELCPNGSFAIGFNLKIDNDIDISGINTIKLICNDVSNTQIVSFDGEKGSWGNNVYCPNNSRFVSFDYKFDPYTGSSQPDDSSGNSVYFYCEDNTELRPTLEGVDGTWIGRKNCAVNYAICGLIVQYQDNQGTKDDTALNNFKFYCCSV